MRTAGSLLSIALGLFLLAAAPASAAGADDRAVDPALLRRVQDAVASADVRATLRGFTARGRAVPLVEGSVASLRVTADLAGSLREDVRDARGPFSSRLVGKLAWEGAGKPRPADPEALARIVQRFHQLVAPLEPAFLAADSLRSRGATEEGWARLVRIEGGRIREWDVDPQSGRVLRFSERALAGDGADGGAAPVETEFDDFREVAGVTWPFRATTYVDGHPLHETVWERFEPAQDLSGEEFLPGQKSEM